MLLGTHVMRLFSKTIRGKTKSYFIRAPGVEEIWENGQAYRDLAARMDSIAEQREAIEAERKVLSSPYALCAPSTVLLLTALFPPTKAPLSYAAGCKGRVRVGIAHSHVRVASVPGDAEAASPS